MQKPATPPPSDQRLSLHTDPEQVMADALAESSGDELAPRKEKKEKKSKKASSTYKSDEYYMLFAYLYVHYTIY